ncbi:hypothetical protein ACFQV4_23050 [Streptomyces thermocarboxydus]
MPLAVAALSHAPSFGNVDPGGETFAEINAAIDEVRSSSPGTTPISSWCSGPTTSTASSTR